MMADGSGGFSVMAGLVPPIHVFLVSMKLRRGCPGTSPGMTNVGVVSRQREEAKSIVLPLDVLLFRYRRGFRFGAGDADLVAVGDTVRGCHDDAILRRDARGQLDVLAEI